MSIMIAALALAQASTAERANPVWDGLGRDAYGATFFYDPYSVEHVFPDSVNMQVWTRLSVDDYRPNSINRLLEFDCSEEQVRTLNAVAFSGLQRQPNTADARFPTAWDRISSEPERRLYTLVCEEWGL